MIIVVIIVVLVVVVASVVGCSGSKIVLTIGVTKAAVAVVVLNC